MSQQSALELHVNEIIQDAVQNHTTKQYLNAKYALTVIHTDPGANKGEHLWFFDINQHTFFATKKSNKLLIQHLNNNNNNNNNNTIKFSEIPTELYGIFSSFEFFLFKVQPFTTFTPLKAADFGSNIKSNHIIKIAKSCKKLSYISYEFKEYALTRSIAQHGINALRNHMNQSHFKQTSSTQQQKEIQQLMAGLLYEMAISHWAQKQYPKCITYSKDCLSYAPNMNEANEVYKYALSAVKKRKDKKSTPSSSSSSSHQHIIYCLRFAD